jgi:transposase
VLTECGWTVRRCRDTYLAAQFWQIVRRRGQERAAMAVGHTILVIARHIRSSPDATYHEPGGDHFTRRVDTARQKSRLIPQLEALGLTVEVTPAA